jgi:hypothetical protein
MNLPVLKQDHRVSGSHPSISVTELCKKRGLGGAA